MSVIYETRGQANEYSLLATNPYRGCGHGCLYCYVPLVLQISRAEFDYAAFPRPSYLKNLTNDARKMAGDKRHILLSFTTDPYHPGDNSLTRDALIVLRNNNLRFCTLTKGGRRALRDLDLFRPGVDAFACTITSLDPSFSAKWERNAAPPDDRIAALEQFSRAGIFTWVSIEPTIDLSATIKIIERTKEITRLYKIGRANYLPMTRTTDWRKYTVVTAEYCAKNGIRAYFKKDLQPYLPSWYENPSSYDYDTA